jgi:hypothetical protein
MIRIVLFALAVALCACTAPPSDWVSRIDTAQMLYTDKEPEINLMVRKLFIKLT